MKLKARLSSVLTWSQFLLSWVTGVTRLSARLDCKSSLQTTKWQSNHERRPKHIGLCHKQTGSAVYHISPAPLPPSPAPSPLPPVPALFCCYCCCFVVVVGIYSTITKYPFADILCRARSGKTSNYSRCGERKDHSSNHGPSYTYIYIYMQVRGSDRVRNGVDLVTCRDLAYQE